MNILIPDSWLRDYLDTKATPEELKEYLSLCGPSIERIHTILGETVYDVEVTTNRPDSMSILGVAREAAAIVPRFGIHAKLKNDPYATDIKKRIKAYQKEGSKKLHIETDHQLNPRWVSIVIDHVQVKPSPRWLQKKLELVGIRPLNTIVDVTNYFMHAYGQPAHAFDYDEIKPKGRIPTMILRNSYKGEKITTLDGKTHTLPGGDIVIEDGSKRLIDLAGIMGGENSSIKSTTKTIVLFMQTYDAFQIRRTSMAQSFRTQASALFEKGLDTELAMPTILDGIKLIEEIAGGQVASKLYDLYPNPYTPYSVQVTKQKLNSYLGKELSDSEIQKILIPLGFAFPVNHSVSTKKRNKPRTLNVNNDTKVTVSVPSYRRDVEIDVDVIEEIARMYGYHNIKPELPSQPPPFSLVDSALQMEEEIKVRLRDWGFTETYTYSMISEELMDTFGLDKSAAYKISNPLSSEWVYMRPSLQPSVLQAVKSNLHHADNIRIFELSMIYQRTHESLPNECPILIVVWSGKHFPEAKGLAESIFDVFGIPFPQPDPNQLLDWKNPHARLSLGTYGSVGILRDNIRRTLGIITPLTVLDLNVAKLVAHAKPQKTFVPIPKYPPVIEDLTFAFQKHTPIGNVMSFIKQISSIIKDVHLGAHFEDSWTFKIVYQNPQRSLEGAEVEKVRKEIIREVCKKFQARFHDEKVTD